MLIEFSYRMLSVKVLVIALCCRQIFYPAQKFKNHPERPEFKLHYQKLTKLCCEDTTGRFGCGTVDISFQACFELVCARSDLGEKSVRKKFFLLSLIFFLIVNQWKQLKKDKECRQVMQSG